MLILLINAGLLAYLAYQAKLVHKYMPAMLREAEKQRLALELGIPVTHLYWHFSRVQQRRVDAWKESLFAHGRYFTDDALMETYARLGDMPEDCAGLFR